MLDFTFLIAYLNSMAQPIVCICIVTEIRETLVRYSWLPIFSLLFWVLYFLLTTDQNHSITLLGITMMVQLIFLFGLPTWTDSKVISCTTGLFCRKRIIELREWGRGEAPTKRAPNRRAPTRKTPNKKRAAIKQMGGKISHWSLTSKDTRGEELLTQVPQPKTVSRRNWPGLRG